MYDGYNFAEVFSFEKKRKNPEHNKKQERQQQQPTIENKQGIVTDSDTVKLIEIFMHIGTMDEEDGRLRLRGEKRGGAAAGAAVLYEKVALVESDSNDINAEEDQSDSDEYSDSGEGLRSKKKLSKRLSKPEDDGIMRGLEGGGDANTGFVDVVGTTTSMGRNRNVDIWHRTLIPDKSIALTLWNGQEWTLFDDGSQTQFVVKLLKFVLMTFLMISLMHVAVRQLFNDYDRNSVTTLDIKLSYYCWYRI